MLFSNLTSGGSCFKRLLLSAVCAIGIFTISVPAHAAWIVTGTATVNAWDGVTNTQYVITAPGNSNGFGYGTGVSAQTNTNCQITIDFAITIKWVGTSPVPKTATVSQYGMALASSPTGQFSLYNSFNDPMVKIAPTTYQSAGSHTSTDPTSGIIGILRSVKATSNQSAAAVYGVSVN